MLEQITQEPVSLLTLIGVAIICLLLLAKGNGVAGFKRAAGEAFKNRQRKAEQMNVLEAVIDEALSDPQYREPTIELINKKVGQSAAGQTGKTTAAS